MQRDSERIFDEYLVAAALSGDHAAWQRLVQRWQPRLLRHAWRLLGDAERARDAVQEAWLEILRGLVRLQDLAAFPAWALRIVSRRCQRLQPAANRECALEPEAEAALGDKAAHAGELAADMQSVRAALDTLPAAQRSALALFYLEDLSVAEIAIALDVPPGTVKTRLMHARHKLRALLGGDADEQAG